MAWKRCEKDSPKLCIPQIWVGRWEDVLDFDPVHRAVAGLVQAFEQFKYAEAVLIANQAERFGLRAVQSRQTV